MFKCLKSAFKEMILSRNAALVSCVAVTAALLSALWPTSVLSMVDVLAFDWVRSVRTDALTAIMIAITVVFRPLYLAAISTAVALALVPRRRRFASVLLVSPLLAAFLQWSLKQLIGRVRPHDMLYLAHGFSFPSGHAAVAAAIAGSVMYCMTDSSFPRAGALVVLLSAGVVALSRVYLNVHFLSDAIAGLALGFLCAAAVIGGMSHLEE